LVALNIIPALDGKTDFLVSYTAGQTIRSGNGRALYAAGGEQIFPDKLTNTGATAVPFDRLAYEALLYVPLSLLGYRNAYWIFAAVNLTLIVLCIRMLQPYLPKLEQLWYWLPSAAFLCFVPLGLALVAGHNSILLLALLLASAVSFYQEHDFRAGVFLGLTLFRPEFSVLIALLFLVWRRWRVVGGFVAASTVCLAISAAVTGLAGFESYLRNAFTWNTQPVPLAVSLNGTVHSTVMPNLWCLMTMLGHQFLSSSSLHAIAAVLALALLVWAANRSANFALAVLVVLLVSYHASIYDTALLILPIAMVMDSRIGAVSGNQLIARNIVAVLFVAFAVFFLLGWNCCLLALLILALLVPLRSTSSGPAPPQLLGAFWPRRQS
ncbi:MAG TPA: glycosyltransferase family 87 protein, partial [Candidatus Acidoferrales bacterium]|nr:glycosyltransferase family 87 protein [Candidatus Acidoferrales bacterium]